MRPALLVFALLASTTPVFAQQQSQPRELGALNQSIKISGQFFGSERRHSYKFSLAERACVRVARIDTTKSLRAYLYDSGGGLLKKARLDPARDRSAQLQQTIFPGAYTLKIELFYSNDTSAVYDLIITRENC